MSHQDNSDFLDESSTQAEFTVGETAADESSRELFSRVYVPAVFISPKSAIKKWELARTWIQHNAWGILYFQSTFVSKIVILQR